MIVSKLCSMKSWLLRSSSLRWHFGTISSAELHEAAKSIRRANSARLETTLFSDYGLMIADSIFKTNKASACCRAILVFQLPRIVL